MDIVVSIIDILLKVWPYLCQQCRHHEGLHENLDILKSKLKELQTRETEVSLQIKEAEVQMGKRPKSEVKLWQENVHRVINEVPKVEENLRNNLRCCKGCFPNYYSRLKLNELVMKKIKELIELQEKSLFVDGLFSDLSSVTKMTLPTASLAGRTAEKTKMMISECLLDGDIGAIGVYGMGGVGKTSIMKHIYNQLIEDSGFNSIIWVNMPKAPLALDQVQNSVAKALDLKITEDADDVRRSQVLYTALERRKKFVLILDDMWNAFPLEKVGIPKPNRENGCKLVLTTRLFEICRVMECQREIKVELLSEEEAWELFKDKVGGNVISPEVEGTAKLVAKECGCLPLAIITVGRSMREKRDIGLWRNTLNELRNSKSEIKTMEEDVFTSLKFSYSRLRDARIQSCFLYCILYPEDFAILTKDLVEHWMMEGFIDEVGDREAGMDKGRSILNELESACMLEVVSDRTSGELVKMHDLIRDMAIQITRVHPRFVAKAGARLKEAMVEDERMEDVERISLMRNNIEWLSGQPHCPKLSTLFLQENPRLKVITESFFEHMHSLKVLDLSNTKIESLPESVSKLENLRALLLHNCARLKKLPTLAKLTALRVLDLHYAPIKEMPHGMEALTNLRHLNLSWTYKLRLFPADILPKLSYLEDLIMYGSQWTWSSNTIEMGGGASINEVMNLTRLANLSIHIVDLPSYLSYVRSRKWQAFKRSHLVVGMLSQPQLLPLDNIVEIHGCDLVDQNNSFLLPEYTQGLGIYICVLTRLSELSCLSNVRELKYCSIYQCDGMMYILMEAENTLTSLETLDLKFLPNLQALYRGTLSHGTLGSLKNLNIDSCHRLKNLISLELLQNLQNLEQIKVRRCNQIEEIIGGEEDKKKDSNVVKLPRLKKLSLRGLQELKRICGSLIICSSLHIIRVRDCRKLKKLPFSMDNIPPGLKMIKGEKEWWDELKWEDAKVKTHLQLLFVEIEQ